MNRQPAASWMLSSAPSSTEQPTREGPKGAEIRFEPSARHLAYLSVLVEAIGQGRPITDAALAPKIGLAAKRISKWRNHLPGFADWITRELHRPATLGFTLVLCRAYSLAMTGSIKHMEFFAKYCGEASPSARTSSRSRRRW